MPVTDPIADLLTRIRNAARSRKSFVRIPYSKLKDEITRVLKESGYVNEVSTVGEGVSKEILVELSEMHRDITLKSVSTPGQRIYVGSKEIPNVLNGLGLAILSTPKGVMSGAKARKENIGGELLCEVY